MSDRGQNEEDGERSYSSSTFSLAPSVLPKMSTMSLLSCCSTVHAFHLFINENPQQETGQSRRNVGREIRYVTDRPFLPPPNEMYVRSSAIPHSTASPAVTLVVALSLFRWYGRGGGGGMGDH